MKIIPLQIYYIRWTDIANQLCIVYTLTIYTRTRASPPRNGETIFFLNLIHTHTHILSSSSYYFRNCQKNQITKPAYSILSSNLSLSLIFRNFFFLFFFGSLFKYTFDLFQRSYTVSYSSMLPKKKKLATILSQLEFLRIIMTCCRCFCVCVYV